MANKMTEIWVAFVIGGGFWLIGFWGQRIYNKYTSGCEGLPATGVWSYLFGVRPGKGNVCLQLAILQIIGLAYLLFVVVVVWFWDAETVRSLGLAIFLLSLAVAGLLWAIQDLLNKLKQ